MLERSAGASFLPASKSAFQGVRTGSACHRTHPNGRVGSPSRSAAEPSPLNSFLPMRLIRPLSSPQLEPRRLKKQLPKILKLLKPDDRILIVGTTRRPFDAELQSFCQVYQKIILVPRPDYASRYGKYPGPGLPGTAGGGPRVTQSAPGDVTAAACVPRQQPSPALPP